MHISKLVTVILFGSALSACTTPNVSSPSDELVLMNGGGIILTAT